MARELRVEFRAEAELVERLDVAAGEIGRSKVIRRLIIIFLENGFGVRDAVFAGVCTDSAELSGQGVIQSEDPLEQKRLMVKTVDARLAGIVSGREAVPAKKNLDVVSAPKGHPDDEFYLVQLRRMKRPSERDISLALNWQGLRASKAFGRLLKAGRIRVLGGAVQEVTL